MAPLKSVIDSIHLRNLQHILQGRTREGGSHDPDEVTTELSTTLEGAGAYIMKLESDLVKTSEISRKKSILIAKLLVALKSDHPAYDEELKRSVDEMFGLGDRALAMELSRVSQLVTRLSATAIQ